MNKSTSNTAEEDLENEDERNRSTLLPVIGTNTGYLLLIAAIVLRVLSRENRPFYTGATGYNLFVSFLFVGALGFYVCGKLSETEVELPANSALLSVIAFFAWLSVTTLFSIYLFSSRMAFGTWIGHLAGLLLLVLIATNNRSLLKYPIAATLASIGCMILYGWYQRLLLYPHLTSQIEKKPELLEGVISPHMYREFMSRLTGFQPSGVLLNPNSLGAIASIGTLLGTGILIFYGLRKWRSEDRMRAFLAFIASGLLMFLLVPLFIWTDSKGVPIAFAAGLTGGVVIGLRKFLESYWPTLVTGLVLLVVAVAGIAFSAGWFNHTSPTSSMGFRMGYWSATLDVARTHPVTGTGLHNLQFAYTRHKPAWAGETRRAHNDYLDLAAEIGIPGLLLFLLVWGLLFVRLIGRTNDNGKDPPESEPATSDTMSPPFILSLVVGIVSLLMMMGLQVAPSFRGFDTTIMRFGLLAVWSGFFVGFSTCLSELEPFLTSRKAGRWILSAAVLFYLVHALVDFDLYVPAVAWALWMTVALLLAPGRGFRDRRVTLSVPGLTGQLISLFILGGLVAILLRGASLFHTAFRWKSLQKNQQEQRPESVRRNFRTLLDKRPGDLILHMEFSQFIHTTYCMNPPTDRRSSLRKIMKQVADKWFPRCVSQLAQANSHFGQYWGIHFRMYRQIRDHRQRINSTPDLSVEEVEPGGVSRRKARKALKKAKTLYPKRPRIRYELGRLYRGLDRPDRARQEFRSALGLHKNQPGQQLKLSEEALREIRDYLDR